MGTGLLNLIVEWESLHLEQFATQYSRYKEEWWNDQGFAPF